MTLSGSFTSLDPGTPSVSLDGRPTHPNRNQGMELYLEKTSPRNAFSFAINGSLKVDWALG
jgi:hypothetical protein